MPPFPPTSYADLRRIVTPEAYRNAMVFISWHNRLTMTPMLETWEALIIAYLCEQRVPDPFEYTAIKTFLENHRATPPLSLEDCRSLAHRLHLVLTQQ